MRKPYHILVLTYWQLNDALIQTYTLPYLRIIRSILPAGSVIHLVTLEKEQRENQVAELENGIRNIRMPLLPFGLKAALKWKKNLNFLADHCDANTISMIHCWCTPAGMIGMKLSRKTGIPFIIDSFEPHAEAMTENGTWKKNGPAFLTLFRAEKRMAREAKHLIAVAPGMEDYARRKYKVDRTCFIKPACVDLHLFLLSKKHDASLVTKFGFEGKIVVVYAGKFGGIYLDDEVFRWFSALHEHFGDKLRVLLLTSHSEEEISVRAGKAGLPLDIIHTEFVPHHQVPAYIGLGDIALTPVKPVPTKKYCSPIKDGEYWAMGIPVMITPGISNDSDLIQEHNAGAIIVPGDAVSLHDAIRRIDLILNESAEIRTSRIRALAERNRNFIIAEEIYRTIYGNIPND